MYCKEKLFDKESQKFMYFLDGQLLSIYGLQNTVLLPTSTLLCTLKTVTYPSHQIIKVCNSTTIVFNTLYLNVKTFFMNEYMFDGDLRSYKATTVTLEMMINKQNQNSISSLIIREHTRELTAFTWVLRMTVR